MGGRSRVAAQMLSGKGFDKVYNVSGGISAWDGAKATGPKEMNLELITGEETPVEIIAIAYQMEENLGAFYRSAVKRTADDDLVDLLGKLAGIEDKHKADLLKLVPAPAGGKTIKAELPAHITEGGFDSQKLLEENQSFLKNTTAFLDLAMMLEAQALDLYLRFADKSSHDDTRNVLHKIASEERAHLASLGKLLDRKI